MTADTLHTRVYTFAGISGSFGGIAVNFMESINIYLQTCSLIIGIALGIMAIVQRVNTYIKNRRDV